jgi:hypothetical protein
MANRIINTEIWDDLLEVSIETRLYYIYLYTSCNHAGLIKPQKAIITVYCGKVDIVAIEKELSDCGLIKRLDNGKLFLPQFIKANYRDLGNNNSNAAKSCIALLAENGINYLTLNEGLMKGSLTLIEIDKEKDKDIDKEKENKTAEINYQFPDNFTDDHKKLWFQYEQVRESIPKPPYSQATRQLAINEFVSSASCDPKKYTEGLKASIQGAWVSPKWFAPKQNKYTPEPQTTSVSAPKKIKYE